ncbi:MAG TPA: hypothetical protein VK822_05665 [Acetobacteraceae bacterium]|jgi:hypothetical protein|nr:hypothetical protein [Acetobacteraceae bacterium]
MSKSKLATDADLPAPLSLTLEDVRNVAGGATFVATVSAAHWWWYGQPANPWLNAVSQANVSNVTVGQVGAVQALGG